MFLDCAFDPVCVRSASYSGMCGGRAAAWLSQKRAAKAGGRVVFERFPDVLRNLLNHRQNHLRNPCPAQGDVFTGDTSNKERAEDRGACRGSARSRQIEVTSVYQTVVLPAKRDSRGRRARGWL